MTIQDLYCLYLRSGKVSIDSRNIPLNSIFFALKGANFNGNQYAKAAIDSGASFAIVDELEYEDQENFIYYVEDSLNALQKLAQYHRTQLNIPIIAITGSNGKTTTKELITTVLEKKYCVAATVGNLNNHIGVPLTLLSINPNHEIAVVEMGANHQKEIEFLCSLAHPDFGYITNFGKAHLEGFGGVEGVIKGKSELYQYLRENDKTVFVNANDPKQVELTADMKTVKFGSAPEVDYKFDYVDSQTGNCPILRTKEFSIESPLVGNYNIHNVAIATAIGLKFDVRYDDIKEAIEAYIADNNRSQIVSLQNKKIILDAYNANPSSMEAAISNFAKLEGDRALILGDMFELGEESQNEHQKIVELAEKFDFNFIYLIGEHFAQANIQDSSKIKQFASRQSAGAYFTENEISENLILIKGSRGMALEKLLDVIH